MGGKQQTQFRYDNAVPIKNKNNSYPQTKSINFQTQILCRREKVFHN